MQEPINTIFCDEAGFTGNDLYSREQPYFVYSSVLIDPLEANEIVQKIVTDFRLQSQELKGSNLLRTTYGKKAALWLLENHSEKALVIAFDKKYSLAGKFFEYVFEPVLAPQSTLFYHVLFHRFISNVLYLHLLTQETYAEQLLSAFQNSARSLDFTPLENALSVFMPSDTNKFLHQILTFAVLHKGTIVQELQVLRENAATGNWVLELSMTGLHSLLSKWGEKLNGMKVFCDDSKPIFNQKDFFNIMINRKDRRYIQVGVKNYPVTFNLIEPIQLVRSKSHSGIQIADVFASSVAYALKEEDDFSIHCRAICETIIHPNSVFPQLEFADLEQSQAYIGMLILTELVERSLRGQSLFDGMSAYIEFALLTFPEWQKRHQSIHS